MALITAGRVLALAAAYFVTGELGLLLAIPPGYASAVWPPSGIALAALILGGYRLWPGVWIGSFLLNLGTGFDAGSASELVRSLAVPAVIGTGAALQAVAGAALVRRFAEIGNVFTQEFQIVRSLLLGGPLACLISSTFGMGTLWMTGVVTTQALPLNWWTWWVGDSIGVLIFMPLVLVWAVRPYRDWIRKQILITAPLALLFALVVLMFVAISRREQARIEAEFAAAAADVSQQLQEDLNDTLSVLVSLEGLFAASVDVRPHEFEIFARRVLAHVEGVQALSWAPRVPSEERARFERAESAAGTAPYRVRQLADDGTLAPAGNRDEYYPVQFTSPPRGNQGLLGFDVSSEPVRRAALEQARDTGRPSASGGVRPVQGAATDADTGLLVFMPVYRHGIQPVTISARRRYLDGFAVAELRLGSLVAVAVAAARQAGFELQLYDEAGGAGALPLYSDGEAAAEAISRTFPINFAGRPWRLEVLLPAAGRVSERSWQTWLVLAGGLLLTGLVGILFLVSTGRAARVEALVGARTLELRRLNENLVQEVALRAQYEQEAVQRASQLETTNQELQRRSEVNRQLLQDLRRSENELRHTAGRLAASNRELEQFAYIASHDLKAPLRTISSFAQLLQQRHGGKLDGDALEFLTYISDGIRQMQGLIEGLLELSRVDTRHLTLEPMSLGDAVQAAKRQLDADLKTSEAQVHVSALPDVRGDRRMLSQLMQNLISNAIKFQKPKQRPEIWIGAAADGDLWHLTVRDNGIGIDGRHLDQIFLIFRRLHTVDQYPGSGIGLAVCKRIVHLHGGEIWATSELGKGTTIHITIPKAPVSDESHAEPAQATG